MKSHSIAIVGTAVAFIGLCSADESPSQPSASSPAQTALVSAAHEQKYLFILFYKRDDSATQAVRHTLEEAVAKRTAKAMSAAVKTTDPAEREVVDRYGVSRSPMPLVLAIAPNGAITANFPLKLTETDVGGAFVSPGLAKCLKATQARKLVLLCVQPAGSSDKLPSGAREFKADPTYGSATAIVKVRADDTAESDLLKMLQLNPETAVPLTALVVPPGRRLAIFEGQFSKDDVIQKLQAAKGGCCPGGKCGPGGCCPGGQCDSK